MNSGTDNGWNEYKKLVLESQKDCKVQYERLHVELVDLRIAFEGFSRAMAVKAGVWGALAGLIPAIAVLLVLALKG